MNRWPLCNSIGKRLPSGWIKNARSFHLDFDARLHLRYTNNALTKWQSGRTVWSHLSSHAIRSHDFKSLAEWKFLCCVQANEVWNGSLTHQTGLTRLQEIRGSLILSQNRQEWKSKKINNNKNRSAYLMKSHKYAMLEVITTISFTLRHVLRRPNRNALLIAIHIPTCLEILHCILQRYR